MVSIEQAESFFDERGASGDCPVCGKNTWGGVGLEGGRTIGLPVVSQEEGSTHRASRQFPVFALVCMSCGFTRLHATEVVESHAQNAEGDGDG